MELIIIIINGDEFMNNLNNKVYKGGAEINNGC